MATNTGTAVTLWTARLAVGMYLARYLVRAGRSTAVPSGGEAIVWSFGAALMLVHVASAFHFYHDWSHDAAYEDTARRTVAVTGLDWGGGVFLNYAMAAWWVCDAYFVCRAAHSRRPLLRGYTLPTQLFFGFMILNATVVFGPRWWLMVAVVGPAGYIGLRLRRQSMTR